MAKKATYALFGGSFDPPHLGHKKIIQKALEYVDKVIVTPTYLNPFKSNFSAKPKLRYKWVKEVFENENVIISDYEIEQKRAVYTYETLKELSKKYNIKAIIIGADNLKSIHKWHNFDYLNDNYLWLVASRRGESLDCQKLKNCKILNIDVDVSSTEIREGKKLDFIDEKIKKQVALEYNLNKNIKELNGN